MDFEERSKLCDRIITGIAVINDCGNFYFIHDPSPLEKIVAEQYYQEVYNNLLNNGFKTKEELLAVLIDKKMWSEDLEKQITIAQEDIKLFKKQLDDCEFKSTKRKGLLKNIKTAKEYGDKLLSTKNSLLNASAEHVATIERYKKLLFLLTKNASNQQFWCKWEVFTEMGDNLTQKLINASFLSGYLNESRIREIARNDPWRSLWSAAGKVGSLFDRPIAFCSDYQRVLLTWSIIYDSVYESMDRPSSDVINNDILLDQWLEAQQEKHRKDSDTKNGLNAITNEKIKNSQEIGIVVDSPEDARKAYALNNSEGLGVLKSREQALAGAKGLKEVELPDVRHNLMMTINKMAMETPKGS